MPIAAHCPNPACARVHQVKNKYAGMRGKCPVCGSWMYIPTGGMMPSQSMPRSAMEDQVSFGGAAVPSRVPLAAPVAPAVPLAAPVSQPAPTRAASPVEEELEPIRLGEVEPIPLKGDRKSKKKGAAARRRLDEDDAADALPMDDEGGEPRAAKKPYFSWLSVLLLVLGILSLGAIVGAPFLAGPSGIEGKAVSGIKEDDALYVMLAPGLPALFALISLTTGLVTRRFGVLGVVLTALASLLTGILLFMASWVFQKEYDALSKYSQRVEKIRAEGGNASSKEISLGQQLPVAVGGAGAAALCFVLATVFMLRPWWGKAIWFILLVTPIALGVVWVFRKELGVDLPDIPI